jgi:hypothetical protein
MSQETKEKSDSSLTESPENVSKTDEPKSERQIHLDQLEQAFEHRFTDKDPEYMRVFNARPMVPPIIFPWPNPSSNNYNQRNNNLYVFFAILYQ